MDYGIGIRVSIRRAVNVEISQEIQGIRGLSMKLMMAMVIIIRWMECLFGRRWEGWGIIVSRRVARLVAICDFGFPPAPHSSRRHRSNADTAAGLRAHSFHHPKTCSWCLLTGTVDLINEAEMKASAPHLLKLGFATVECQGLYGVFLRAEREQRRCVSQVLATLGAEPQSVSSWML